MGENELTKPLKYSYILIIFILYFVILFISDTCKAIETEDSQFFLTSYIYKIFGMGNKGPKQRNL